MAIPFHEFTVERWGPNWGLCRATPANKARYDRCVSQKEYDAAMADFRRQHPTEYLRHHAMNAGDTAADLLAVCEAALGSDDAELRDMARAAIAKATTR